MVEQPLSVFYILPVSICRWQIRAYLTLTFYFVRLPAQDRRPLVCKIDGLYRDTQPKNNRPTLKYCSYSGITDLNSSSWLNECTYKCLCFMVSFTSRSLTLGYRSTRAVLPNFLKKNLIVNQSRVCFIILRIVIKTQ
jgi:hypothetical protein